MECHNTIERHLIKTVDSDAIVIAVTVCDKLNGLHELLMQFGKKTTVKYIPNHEIARGFGKASSRDISFLHILGRCDT